MQRTSRYHTTEILGEGGNAKVYRAWDSLQKREVALKVLKSSSAADETSRLRFQREADILAGLDGLVPGCSKLVVSTGGRDRS